MLGMEVSQTLRLLSTASLNYFNTTINPMQHPKAPLPSKGSSFNSEHLFRPAQCKTTRLQKLCSPTQLYNQLGAVLKCTHAKQSVVVAKLSRLPTYRTAYQVYTQQGATFDHRAATPSNGFTHNVEARGGIACSCFLSPPC